MKGINLTVDSGDFYSLLGPNGAGKTTAIGIICSLVNKTEGSITVFGKDIQKMTVIERKSEKSFDKKTYGNFKFVPMLKNTN